MKNGVEDMNGLCTSTKTNIFIHSFYNFRVTIQQEIIIYTYIIYKQLLHKAFIYRKTLYVPTAGYILTDSVVKRFRRLKAASKNFFKKQ